MGSESACTDELIYSALHALYNSEEKLTVHEEETVGSRSAIGITNGGCRCMDSKSDAHCSQGSSHI